MNYIDERNFFFFFQKPKEVYSLSGIPYFLSSESKGELAKLTEKCQSDKWILSTQSSIHFYPVRSNVSCVILHEHDD